MTNNEIDDCFRKASSLAGAERLAYLRSLPEAMRGEVKVLLEADSEAADSGFLRGGPTLVGNVQQEDADDELNLSFLEPTDDPKCLGRLGHYEVKEILGHGAFGIVFRAFDEKLHRQVAIKAMLPHLAATSPPRKRFLREAQSAAAIRHENVVQVYSVEEQPIPYLVMECISGVTLQHRLQETGPLEVPEVIEIAEQVAFGLSAAHETGLIHRDVKPANILIEDGTAKVKLTDFGLARAADDASITRTGVIAGTPMYMSPEQARSKDFDARSDLFSLGSVIYEMSCGRPPFRAPDLLGVLRRVAEDTPRSMRSVLSSIPVWLERIVERLHAKMPEERLGSAGELHKALSACRENLTSNAPIQIDSLLPKKYKEIDTSSAPVTKSNSRIGLALVAAAVAVMALLVFRDRFDGSKPDTPVTIGNKPEADIPPSNAGDSEGWYGWPTDAPSPAISPFDANAAEQMQEKWAEYLDLPVEFTDSFGVTLRLIPPGEFLMGSDEAEVAATVEQMAPSNPTGELWKPQLRSESPDHRVILTQPFYMGTTEITVAAFKQVMSESAGNSSRSLNYSEKDRNLPIEKISWVDAAEFCSKASLHEKLKPAYIRLKDEIKFFEGTGYRLPTEAEWEFACRAGTTTRFWNGDTIENTLSIAWTSENSNGSRHPVGEFLPNPFCLFDMTGNISEWCEDDWNEDNYAGLPNPCIDPIRRVSKARHVNRGGSWGAHVLWSRSAAKMAHTFSLGAEGLGLRVVLPTDAVRQLMKRKANVVTDGTNDDSNAKSDLRDRPSLAMSPFGEKTAQSSQHAWAEYLGIKARNQVLLSPAVNMDMMLIPPGEFAMGASQEERSKFPDDSDRNESPKHRVVISKPFLMGRTEVTFDQFEVFVEETGYVTDVERNKNGGQGYSDAGLVRSREFSWKNVAPGELEGAHPVTNVSWNDANEFCNWLSKTTGNKVRLPSEAEWEYACRAGSNAAWCFGDNVELLGVYCRGGQSLPTKSRKFQVVGLLKSNNFGLQDMHGNLSEWCIDAYDRDFYASSPSVDPVNDSDAEYRTARGGAYGSGSGACRSAFRFEQSPRQGFVHSGFRVVVEPQTLGVRNDPLSAGTILLEGCSLGLLLNNEQKLVNCESISELPQTDFSVKSVEVRGKTVSPGLLQSISLLSELEELTLFNVHLPANSLSLSTIAGLSRLRVLNIHGDERTGQVELNDFASLAQLKLLTHLYFDLTDLSDLDVSSFGKMNNLTHLSISGTDITDKALASISDFPQLEYLNFSHTSVTDRGLQMLQRHLTLKELSVANTDVTSAGVISMLKSSEVDHLRAIGRQVAFDESESPDCIQNLKTLVISQADSLSFQWLQNAHNLETLWVTSSSEIDADFGNRLSQAPIHELRFEKCKFGSNSLVGLRKLTNLKTLSVIHCEIPSGEVEALKDLLPELTISTD